LVPRLPFKFWGKAKEPEISGTAGPAPWAAGLRHTPPAPLSDEQRAQRRRRILLIGGTVVGLAIAGVAGFAYQYAVSAPLRAEAEFRAGIALMAPGHYDEAVAHFDRVLEMDPNRRDIYLRRALAHQELGQADAALADYQAALDVNPRDAAVYSARGALYRERGDFPAALKEFDRAVQLSQDTDAYFQRAVTYDLMGDYRKAVEDFDQVVAAVRDAPHVLRARALVKRKLGDVAGYEADLRQAREFEGRHLR
jgi:tetratricopeptide (TPR) repeat protein